MKELFLWDQSMVGKQYELGNLLVRAVAIAAAAFPPQSPRSNLDVRARVPTRPPLGTATMMYAILPKPKNRS
jgi:hypothetical protein